MGHFPYTNSNSAKTSNNRRRIRKVGKPNRLIGVRAVCGLLTRVLQIQGGNQSIVVSRNGIFVFA